MTADREQTVTFLMTDIEGSTALWESFPRQMQEALARHDAIMLAGIEHHGGEVVKHRGEGDSVFAVFSDPSDAVAAACDLQMTMHSEQWSTPHPLRIRMALHMGTAESRGGDFFGSAVNRCARLRAIAHGGQTLISAVTAERVAGQLPDDVSLRDLGHHRLRDLTQPEHVMELVHPDLPETFPPLRSLDVHAHNLPVQTTPFVGRDRELADLKSLLADQGARLLTLTGPGGIGKTRLSLQVAADLVEVFRDGVYFVDLSAIGDPSLVPSAIAQTFGVRESAARSLHASLMEFFPGKHMLLILDNFEQVLPAASTVAAIHGVCPMLHILVNSRSVLHLSGERVYPLAPLAMPAEEIDSGGRSTLNDIQGYEAVQLFEVRARAVKHDFAITQDNAAAVATICRQVDGLPLAIELAAARVRLLPPQAIARRLVNALPLLTGGARDLPVRQQTLRGAIAWSYDLLPGPERALFRRLSVFAGGFTFESADVIAGEPIAAGDVLADVFDGIAALVDASLLEQRETPDGEPRFRILQVVRGYGLEQLDTAGEAAEAQRRHAGYYFDLAIEAEPHLQGAHQQQWLGHLRVEHDNLRVALAWFRDHGDPQDYLRLAGSLFWFWFGHGHWSEALEWYQDALDRAPAPTLARAAALYGAGTFGRSLGDYATGRRLLEEGIDISRQLGDRTLEARTMHFLAILMAEEGDHAGSREMQERALDIARQDGDTWTIGVLLRQLAAAAAQDGDIQTASALIDESVEIHRRADEQWALAHALNAYGDLMRGARRYDDATLRYQESLQLFSDLGIKDGRPSVLHNLGYVALGQGDSERAARLFQEALSLFQHLGDQRGSAECLAGYAAAIGVLGHPVMAARLFGASQAIFDRTGTQISGSNRADSDHALQFVRSALSRAEFDAEFDAGYAADQFGVIEDVLATAPSPPDA